MNFPNNTRITGTIHQKDKNTERFCDYYRCSIYGTGDVARYRNMTPVQIGANMTTPEEISTEPVYNIRVTEGMLNDMIRQFTEKMEEIELRHSDSRLMKMYSEYMTLLNLLK